MVVGPVRHVCGIARHPIRALHRCSLALGRLFGLFPVVQNFFCQISFSRACTKALCRRTLTGLVAGDLPSPLLIRVASAFVVLASMLGLMPWIERPIVGLEAKIALRVLSVESRTLF